MDESEQLRNIVNWRKKQKRGGPVRLADALSELVENRVSPRQARFSAVAKLWNRLLPAELRQHCEITDISNGQLKVRVDSSSYMYELQLCSSELLGELQQQCPQVRLTKIKFAIT